MVEVRAKPEPLLVVAAKDAHHLARLAWHLGNRHVPAAIEDDRILIRPDHVLAEMLAGPRRRGLGDRGAVRSGGRRLCSMPATVIIMTTHDLPDASPRWSARLAPQPPRTRSF